MRDYKKLMDLIKKTPDRSNEFLLNSAGSAPGISSEKLYMENKALTAIKNSTPEIWDNICKCLS